MLSRKKLHSLLKSGTNLVLNPFGVKNYITSSNGIHKRHKQQLNNEENSNVSTNDPVKLSDVESVIQGSKLGIENIIPTNIENKLKEESLIEGFRRTHTRPQNYLRKKIQKGRNTAKIAIEEKIKKPIEERKKKAEEAAKIKKEENNARKKIEQKEKEIAKEKMNTQEKIKNLVISELSKRYEKKHKLFKIYLETSRRYFVMRNLNQNIKDKAQYNPITAKYVNDSHDLFIKLMEEKRIDNLVYYNFDQDIQVYISDNYDYIKDIEPMIIKDRKEIDSIQKEFDLNKIKKEEDIKTEYENKLRAIIKKKDEETLAKERELAKNNEANPWSTIRELSIPTTALNTLETSFPQTEKTQQKRSMSRSIPKPRSAPKNRSQKKNNMSQTSNSPTTKKSESNISAQRSPRPKPRTAPNATTRIAKRLSASKSMQLANPNENPNENTFGSVSL
jgi:hypothetical protein